MATKSASSSIQPPTSLPGRLNRLARPAVLAALAALVALFYLALFPGMIAASPALQQTGMLDTRLSYSPAAAYQALEVYGPAGRAQYARTTTLLDFIFPVVYTLLLSLLAARGLARAFPSAPRMGWLALQPLAALLFDWLENGCVLALLLSYPRQLDGLAAAAGVFTLLKWISFTLAVLITAGSLLAARLRRQA